MGVRQISQRLIAIGAMVLMGHSFSGGTEFFNSVSAPMTYAGTYVEGNVGYSNRNWVSALDLRGMTQLSYTNGATGVVGGLSGGYQFNRYVALELGWEYIPQFKIKLLGQTLNKINSWFAYVGPKLMIPLFLQASLFIKGGVAYSYNKDREPRNDFSGLGGAKSNYWTGMVAIGTQYYFTPALSAGLQAGYVPGRRVAISTPVKFTVPEIFYYVATLGYKFMC